MENKYSRELFLEVPLEFDGYTVEMFLKEKWDITSRLLKKLKQIEMGLTADGQHVRTVDEVKSGQIIKLSLPGDTLAIPAENLTIEVLYEDEDLLAVNKPSDMAVHPTFGYIGPTLAGGVINYFLNKGQIISARPLNRLDRYTSGVVIFAKNTFSASCLLHGSKKEYCAIVRGELDGSGVIAMPIRRAPDGGIQREVHADGKYSRTRWWCDFVDRTNKFSKLKVVIDTGRTHQIRVHFKWLGHPLVGDFMYGVNAGLVDTTCEPMSRQALHCKKIEFVHPFKKSCIEIVSPYPCDMLGLIAFMKK